MPLLWQQDALQAKAGLYQSQGQMIRMDYSARLSVRGDPDKLLECLKPEESDFDRSKFTIDRTEEGVVFDITAKDAVAFRATLNSIAQLLIVFEGARKDG